MTTPAHVTSIEAVHNFRAAFIRFAEEATAAVDTWRQEVLRTQEWIETDRPGYWRQQVRLGFDGIAQARSRLEVAQQRVFDGQGPSCIEEKQDLRAAQQRLQFAQEQVRVVRQWAMKLQRESDDFRGRIGHLESALKRDIPRAIAKLQRMAEALDRYAEVAQPNEPPRSTTPKPKAAAETKTDVSPASPSAEPTPD